MSKPRHQFPTIDEPANTPAWLSRKGHPSDDVKTLMSILQGDPASQQQAAKRSIEPPMPVPSPTLPPPQEPESEPPPSEPEVSTLEVPDELSRLPDPPRLGSLLPGGRSNPPPAHLHDDAMDERIQAFASAAVELSIARAATLAVLEGQLLDLAIEVAAALIEKEVDADPKLHAVLARAALQSLGDATQVTLRTSPEGFDAITSALGGTDVDMRGVRVQIVADQTIPGLGCVVEGDSVRVDASVTERLRAVRRAFEEERRRTAESVE